MSDLEFLNELQTPDLYVQYCVLSRLENQTWKEPEIAEFSTLALKEPDRGTRFQMDLILRRYEHAQSRSLARANPLTPAELDKLFASPSGESAVSLAMELMDLEPGQISVTLDNARNFGAFRKWKFEGEN